MCHILPKCNGEKLFYHCVIQYSYKEIIEVCAPVGIITGDSNTLLYCDCI